MFTSIDFKVRKISTGFVCQMTRSWQHQNISLFFVSGCLLRDTGWQGKYFVDQKYQFILSVLVLTPLSLTMDTSISWEISMNYMEAKTRGVIMSQKWGKQPTASVILVCEWITTRSYLLDTITPCLSRQYFFTKKRIVQFEPTLFIYLIPAFKELGFSRCVKYVYAEFRVDPWRSISESPILNPRYQMSVNVRPNVMFFHL